MEAMDVKLRTLFSDVWSSNGFESRLANGTPNTPRGLAVVASAERSNVTEQRPDAVPASWRGKRPPSTPDRRTAAGREDSGLAAQLAKLKEVNKILVQENALLRAELANRDHGLVFDVQQPASLEALNIISYGAAASSSSLDPGNGPGPAPSTYTPSYSAQVLPCAHPAHGGPSSHPAPPAPPIGPLIIGLDFDCIGDMFDEAALFPFGHYGPYATGPHASGSGLDT
ncbi:hypothetical protein AURDEDRAFT_165983 [Auricularia subglabra TFB-10046 SS5]|nr:hypothetical protein AURDEDRAFT_165983 [Auricularia subglabra TFB-10046 SS5]